MSLMVVPEAPPPSARLLCLERAVSFGHKTGWLAVRHDDPRDVLCALDARGARRAPWSRGVYAAYRGDAPEDAFVTPSLDGWVLVATSLLPGAGRDGAPLREVLERLSARLGTTVQCFGNHSELDTYLWALAERGALARCFARSSLGASDDDEDQDAVTTCDLGQPTQAERELGFFAEDWSPADDDVPRLAGRWSLDPRRLHERFTAVEPLWVCTLARH